MLPASYQTFAGDHLVWRGLGLICVYVCVRVCRHACTVQRDLELPNVHQDIFGVFI